MINLIKKMLLAIAFASANSEAGWFDSKVQEYECPTYSSAEICSSVCKKSGDEIEVMLNVQEKNIFFKRYTKGKLTGKTSYDNCKIFDKKNWECTYESRILFQKIVMADGKYFMFSTMYVPRQKNSDSFYCSK